MSAKRAYLVPAPVLFCACTGLSSAAPPDASFDGTTPSDGSVEGGSSLDGGVDSSSDDSGNADAGPRGFRGQPCSQYSSCTTTGDMLTCDCEGGTFPLCEASVGEGVECDLSYTGNCYGCSQGIVFACRCWDAGPPGLDGGPRWLCLDGTVCQ